MQGVRAAEGEEPHGGRGPNARSGTCSKGFEARLRPQSERDERRARGPVGDDRQEFGMCADLPRNADDGRVEQLDAGPPAEGFPPVPTQKARRRHERSPRQQGEPGLDDGRATDWRRELEFTRKEAELGSVDQSVRPPISRFFQKGGGTKRQGRDGTGGSEGDAGCNRAASGTG